MGHFCIAGPPWRGGLTYSKPVYLSFTKGSQIWGGDIDKDIRGKGGGLFLASYQYGFWEKGRNKKLGGENFFDGGAGKNKNPGRVFFFFF